MCHTIFCVTLCITNGDFRAFCVTERASVTSVSRNEKADNRLIISLLLGAENETRTRDPNLGKVVLYQLSYFRMECFPIASAKVYKKSESPNFSGLFCGIFVLKPGSVPLSEHPDAFVQRFERLFARFAGGCSERHLRDEFPLPGQAPALAHLIVD